MIFKKFLFLQRMIELQYIPDNDLTGIVESIWYQECVDMNLTSLSIPFLNQELVINYGDEFVCSRPGEASFHYNSFGSVSGLNQGPVYSSVSGAYRAMGILLKPFGLYRLFGFNASKLEHGPVGLEYLLKDRTADLLMQLKSISVADDKIKCLEEFLLKHSEARELPIDVVQFLLEFGHAPIQKGKIKAYLTRIEKSSKSFVQSFHTVLGITPLKYLRIAQLNRAIGLISSAPQMKLTEVAYESGFYDQSHFIRVFRSLAGITPNEYRQAVIKEKIFQPFPNTIFLS